MKFKKLFEDFFDDIDDAQQDITGEFNTGSGDAIPGGEFLMYANVRQFDYWSSGYSGNKYYDKTKGVRLGYRENETQINLYEMLRIFKLIANNCRFMSDAVVTVKMKVEDWDDNSYFEEDITNGISQNKKYGVNFFDMEDWCFKRHKDADDMSVYLSAEYTFGITFNAEPMGMKKLSDEMKKIIMIFRNYTFKEKTQYGQDINKRYIETIIIESSDGKRTISDGSHGVYIDTSQNRYFSNFNELEDLYKYLYNKSPLEQRNELLNNILKKNHIEQTISDIVEKFRYQVKKYGAALRIFKYRFEKSAKSSKNENYYDTCHVLFIDVMFDKDADSENMTCEDVLYDLS